MSGLLIFLVGSWFVLAVVYVVMVPVFWINWLKFYRLDTDLSSEERLASWVVLSIATIFWPLVVPFAYLTLLRQRQQEREGLQILKVEEQKQVIK